MSVSRVKTIVLAMLVLINLFFLSVIVIDTVADMQSERLALENTCAVLRAGGITIYPESIKTDDPLLSDDSSELSSVSTILLGFLAAVKDEDREDVVCTYIYSVELVRYSADVEHRETESITVWRITGNAGNYLIDDTTGEVTVDNG